MVKLAVAVLLAAVAAAVYRSSVFSKFEPVRLDVVTAEVYSARHIIPITLPDLAALRGQTALLGLQIRNTRTEQRQIGLLGGGLPRNRAVLAPNQMLRWDIVLPPDVVRALERPIDRTAPTLELTADADGWALTSVDIRNYYIRLGNDPMVAVVPSPADGYTAGVRFVPVVTVLCFLALMSAFGSGPGRPSVQLVGNGLALSAALTCVIILLLPLFSRYKAILSPLAFTLIAAALFSPVLIHAVSTLAVTTPRRLRRSMTAIAAAARRGSGYWKRHEVTFERAAVLFGLGALAIAQPIFEVVSNSPEFFAARGTTATTALTAVFAICFGIPLLLTGLERVIRLFSAGAAKTLFGFAVAVLAAVIVMPWFQRGHVLGFPWNAAASGFIGMAVALADARIGIIRQFLTVLAPAALVVPTLFLLEPAVRQSFLPSESAAAIQTVERTPPIVFVVFDELPLNSLLDVDGNIDAERYPNFAALARDAYWFRNASTVASNTAQAVPAILSGRYPTTLGDMPTLRYYPVNLFTALARHYRIFASLRFQKLCPPRACQDNGAAGGDTIGSLLLDLGLVWMHIVLPEDVTDELPPVTDDWAEFGETRETAAGDIRNTRGGAFAEFIASIDGQPGRLHFIHSMLPHMPFEYVPSGRRYHRPDDETRMFRMSRLFERASAAYADTLHQRHLAQVGFVDRLIGDLLVRLREAGSYDKAVIVVTADHGASYREGRARRRVQPQRNLSEILRVPLIVRLPGQQGGQVVDRIVESVDILPTILDVIGAKASLRLDGRSLVDSNVRARSTRTFIWRSRSNVTARTFEDSAADRTESLERKARRFGRGDGAALYAPGAARHLLGMNVTHPSIRPARDVEAGISNAGEFKAVSLERDPLPLYVAGALRTSRPDPLTVAVAVNGIVTAVTHSYRDRDAHVFGTLIPESSLREGHNAVAALVVEEPQE